MKYRLLSMLLCASCLFGLTSCEEFFHSEVPYKGNKEDQKLVVNATLNEEGMGGVYVSHSFFMFDSAQYVLVTDTFFYDEDNYYTYSYEERSYGWLDDADVTLTIGSQAPVSLKFSYADSQRPYYQPESVLDIQGGDTVLLHVYHPEYGHAYGRQVQPKAVKGSVDDVRFNSFGQISFTLGMDPYEGADDDVITISYAMLEGSGTVTQSTKSFFNPEKETWQFESYYGNPTIYSLDPVFSQLANQQTSSGYYGGLSLSLPATALRNGLSVNCIIDKHLVQNDPDITYNVTYDSVKLAINLDAQTFDGYRYTSSYANVSEDNRAVDDPSHIMQTGSDSFFDEINDIFSSLGGAEDYLLFGNLSSKEPTDKNMQSSAVPDVFGHFSLESKNYFMYEYHK